MFEKRLSEGLQSNTCVPFKTFNRFFYIRKMTHPIDDQTGKKINNRQIDAYVSFVEIPAHHLKSTNIYIPYENRR
jgi:hypothetical protein